MKKSLNEPLIESVCIRIKESLHRIEICLNLLTDDLIWNKINAESNSVGNLILHLSGNIRQYIVSGLGGKKDVRLRSAEFELSSRIEKQELWKNHNELVQEALNVIESLKNEDLSEEIRIQGFDLNKTDVLIHVTEHYSYHTGQVALLTKLMTNKNLGFYKDLNLNALNE